MGVLLASTNGCGSEGAEPSEPERTTDAAPVATRADADAGGATEHDTDAASTGDSGQEQRDAGRTRDAGRADAGGDHDDQDSGTRDASRHDAGATDSGTRDAGAQDGGRTDAGSTTNDAGLKTTVVNATIVVAAGQTYDGKGQRYIAGKEVGDGSQAEDQKPLFKVEDGATLKNVVLGSPAADGVHTHGDATLENIVWEDIGEDAMTIKEPGTVTLNGGSARNGDDKVFQINAESVFRVSNFTASHAGKFIRQNGGTTFKVQVYVDHCDISDMDEVIFRTDSKLSTVSLTNTRYSQLGKGLFMGVAAGNSTESGNTEY